MSAGVASTDVAEESSRSALDGELEAALELGSERENEPLLRSQPRQGRTRTGLVLLVSEELVLMVSQRAIGGTLDVPPGIVEFSVVIHEFRIVQRRISERT